MTHWQHPQFHAYFPAGNSYPSILGDMLGDAIGCVGFSWAASPACTELETIMLDWMGKMIGLPDAFLTNVEASRGGGVIQVRLSTIVIKDSVILFLQGSGKRWVPGFVNVVSVVAYLALRAAFAQP